MTEPNNTNNDWYKPSRGGDFAGYLHNKWGYPSPIEEKAIKKQTKLYGSKEEMASSVYNYLVKYFGDSSKNHIEGLSKQYKKLRLDVIDNKLIGSIIWAADCNNLEREISKYTTINNTKITLMTDIICKNLLEEYHYHCKYFYQ